MSQTQYFITLTKKEKDMMLSALETAINHLTELYESEAVHEHIELLKRIRDIEE